MKTIKGEKEERGKAEKRKDKNRTKKKKKRKKYREKKHECKMSKIFSCYTSGLVFSCRMATNVLVTACNMPCLC